MSHLSHLPHEPLTINHFSKNACTTYPTTPQPKHYTPQLCSMATGSPHISRPGCAIACSFFPPMPCAMLRKIISKGVYTIFRLCNNLRFFYFSSQFRQLKDYFRNFSHNFNTFPRDFSRRLCRIIHALCKLDHASRAIPYMAEKSAFFRVFLRLVYQCGRRSQRQNRIAL